MIYPGSLAAEIQRKKYGKSTKMTDNVLRGAVSRCHEDGRNINSETKSSKKKKIWISVSTAACKMKELADGYYNESSSFCKGNANSSSMVSRWLIQIAQTVLLSLLGEV